MTAPPRDPEWKCGNEYLPYHPQASHVPPDYRDGWNACYAAAQDGRVPCAPPREPMTDDAILNIAAREADELDATRVHELRDGAWHATTIFDGDAALLRFARALLDAAPAPSAAIECEIG